jgi:large repetitive protein
LKSETLPKIPAFAILILPLLLAIIILGMTGNLTSAADPSKLVINELMADNALAVEGPSLDYPDWVELYNSNSFSINLTGMYLTDDPENPTWQFPEDTIIPAEGYLVIWADGNPDQDTLHADFRLSANGETVALLAQDGVTVIDEVNFNKQIEDVSYGRIPDGSSSFHYMTKSTPGGTNVANTENEAPTHWIVWPIIALFFTGCFVFLAKDKIVNRRKE